MFRKLKIRYIKWRIAKQVGMTVKGLFEPQKKERLIWYVKGDFLITALRFKNFAVYLRSIIEGEPIISEKAYQEYLNLFF